VQGISQANSTYRLAWFYWVRLCKAKTAVPKTGINEHRRWVVRDSPLLGWISWLKARLCCGHFALFVAFSIIAFSLTRSFLIRASWSPLSVTRSEHQVYFLLTIIHLLGTLVCTAWPAVDLFVLSPVDHDRILVNPTASSINICRSAGISWNEGQPTSPPAEVWLTVCYLSQNLVK